MSRICIKRRGEEILIIVYNYFFRVLFIIWGNKFTILGGRDPSGVNFLCNQMSFWRFLWSDEFNSLEHILAAVLGAADDGHSNVTLDAVIRTGLHKVITLDNTMSKTQFN